MALPTKLLFHSKLCCNYKRVAWVAVIYLALPPDFINVPLKVTLLLYVSI